MSCMESEYCFQQFKKALRWLITSPLPDLNFPPITPTQTFPRRSTISCPSPCWLYSQFTELGNWQHFLFYQNNNNNNIISTTFIMQALPLCFQCSTTKMFVFIISTMEKILSFDFIYSKHTYYKTLCLWSR